MNRLSILALGAVLAVSAAPNAFAWGAYHGGFGGASYNRSFSATGPRGGSVSGSSSGYRYGGYRGGAAGGYHGGYYGGGAYGYHGGYYGGGYH